LSIAVTAAPPASDPASALNRSRITPTRWLTSTAIPMSVISVPIVAAATAVSACSAAPAAAPSGPSSESALAALSAALVSAPPIASPSA
jgi:hypothetical protein